MMGRVVIQCKSIEMKFGFGPPVRGKYAEAGKERGTQVIGLDFKSYGNNVRFHPKTQKAPHK